MKVMQIIPNFDLAGAETMCENLIYELSKRGVSVIAVSMYSYETSITKRLEKAGVDIRYLGKKKGLDLRVFWRFLVLFLKEKPDVVHTHLYACKTAMLMAILARVKIRVHTVHNIAERESNYLSRRINKILFKWFDVVPVALSEEVQKTVAIEYKIKAGNIPVIYNGINLDKCRKKQSYSSKSKFKVLHIGRFSEQKNHKMIIEAFYCFLKIYPNAELHLIGDGETKVIIEKYVEDHSISDHVKLLGKHGNVYPFLSDADVFILPSKYEGMPMTLIEAMGTGLPIIATAVGGVPDMLTNGKDALLIDVSKEQFIRALKRLAEDEKLRQSLGEEAWITAHKFSASCMAEKYLKIYRRNI